MRRFGERAPQWPFRRNFNSPQSDGLALWYSGLVGRNLTRAVDLSGGPRGGDATLMPTSVSPSGFLGFDNADKSDQIDLDQTLAVTPNFAFFIFIDANGTDGNNAGYWRTSSTGDCFNITNTSASGRPWIRMNGTDVLQPTSGEAVPTTGLHRMIYNMSSGDSAWWLDGVKHHTSSTTYTDPSNDLIERIGRHAGTGLNMFGHWIDTRFYTRKLPDSLCEEMTGDPARWWDLYAPRRTFVAVPEAAVVAGRVPSGLALLGVGA